jgi:hypothetical protein
MPYLENVDDLAESLADGMGIWGGCRDESPDGCHLETWCRTCWVIAMKQRIQNAVTQETVPCATPS